MGLNLSDYTFEAQGSEWSLTVLRPGLVQATFVQGDLTIWIGGPATVHPTQLGPRTDCYMLGQATGVFYYPDGSVAKCMLRDKLAPLGVV